MSTTINYNYYNTLTTKLDSHKYSYRGKPNMPNLNIVSGTHAKSYVASNIIIDNGKMLIEHTPNTNSDGVIYTLFYLITDPNIKPNEIDKLISMAPGNKMELDMNDLLAPLSKKYTVENDKHGKMVGIVYEDPISIQTKLNPITEGMNCADYEKRKGEIDQMIQDVKNLKVHVSSDKIQTEDDVLKLMKANKDLLNNIGPDGKMQDMVCDAFPSGDTSEQVQYVSLPINKTLSESQANSKLTVMMVAYVLYFAIGMVIVYAVAPPIYKGMLSRFKETPLPVSALAKIRTLEGFITFIVFSVCIILNRVKTTSKSGAAEWIGFIWMLVILVISQKKDSMLDEVFDKAPAIKSYYGDPNTPMQKGAYGTSPVTWSTFAMIYSLAYLWFFPLVYIVEQVVRAVGTGTADSKQLPPYITPPLVLHNTYTPRTKLSA